MHFSSWPFTFLLLCVLHTVRAAFTTSVCNNGRQYCIQKDTAGSWCFASTLIIQATASSCGLPYSVALAAHLKQDLSIAYYSPRGERLGGADYPVPAGTIVYLCASAELEPGQYHTIVALVPGDNDWYPAACHVNLAPSHVSDGCFGKVSVPFFFDRPTRSPT